MEIDKSVTAELGKTFVKYVAPFLIGALMTLLFSMSGAQQELRQNTKAIEELKTRQNVLEQNTATNKRVDDLQSEMRARLDNVDTKLDNVIKILIERR